jgi:alkylation response protein AidB-like acyl-CoA dehydrogenase
MDSETFALPRETVRGFVDERLIPGEEGVEHEDAVPIEIIKEMRDWGVFGMTVLEEFGGLVPLADSRIDAKVEQFYPDVRVLRIYEGTRQLQQTIVPKTLLREAGLTL